MKEQKNQATEFVKLLRENKAFQQVVIDCVKKAMKGKYYE